MPEPILTSAGLAAAGKAFALGCAGGAGKEIGGRVTAHVCDELSKATEEGWQRHDEANEAWGTGLSQRKTSQA